MLTKKQRLDVVLAVYGLKLYEFANMIKRSTTTVQRYYAGEFKNPNAYLDHKLDDMWDSAVIAIKEHEVLKYK